MTTARSTLGVRGIAIGVAIVIACAIPGVAWALNALGTWDNPAPLTVPSHVESTLASETVGGSEYVYTAHLTKGETISATITANAANEVYGAGLSDNYPAMWSWSDAATSGVQVISLLAPSTGKYFLDIFGDAVGTFTVDVAQTPTRKFTFGSLSVPTSAKHKKSFTLSAKLTPDYNGLSMPIRFYIQKKSGSTWKPYTSKPGNGIAKTSSETHTTFTLKTSISKKATYRVRARFSDAAHSATYTGFKSIKIK